ncbi:MAG TPA: thiolase family protein [Acidimicrobiales bacterium]|nr:thiolase family protein [Acidimicrobiales bacterium]
MTAFLSGAGLTPFGRIPGRDALEWQAEAARMAMADAGVGLNQVDALVCGYATTVDHLMPANLLAEYLGLTPQVAFGTSVGGATGLAMVAQAVTLIESGAARCVLVAAGEDRASGQSRDAAISVLAQVGHRQYEVPLGANIPAYYALLASAYLDRHGADPATALAPLAVQMRAHAARHPGAQFRAPVTVDDVLASRPVSEPLHLLDCCPVSDGGAALVVTAGPASDRSVPVLGMGQAHRHQHVTEADLSDLGAARAASAALARAGVTLDDIDIAGIYDSFTVTLALLLEEIGFAEPGKAGAMAARGDLDLDGRLPVNTHGGLLSSGHCGVGGGMAHVVELLAQLRGTAGDRQVARPLRRAFVHADGGVLSAHVSAVLGAAGETP